LPGVEVAAGVWVLALAGDKGVEADGAVVCLGMGATAAAFLRVRAGCPVFLIPPKLEIRPPGRRNGLFVVAVAVVELFEPLQKLKVVLVPALDESFDLNMLEDVEFGEALLEYFEVGNELVIEFGLPVDFPHGYLPGIECL
jgi:hypothetical protein